MRRWRATDVLGASLVAKGGSAVINVGSIGGLRHLGPDHVGYSAAQAALVQFTRQIAGRHARDGVPCSIVIPGMIDTPLLEHRVSRQKGRADLATWPRTKPSTSPGRRSWSMAA